MDKSRHKPWKDVKSTPKDNTDSRNTSNTEVPRQRFENFFAEEGLQNECIMELICRVKLIYHMPNLKVAIPSTLHLSKSPSDD